MHYCLSRSGHSLSPKEGAIPARTQANDATGKLELLTRPNPHQSQPLKIQNPRFVGRERGREVNLGATCIDETASADSDVIAYRLLNLINGPKDMGGSVEFL